uniref:Orf183, hypothetical mitochondrial protein n=1 Tax=Ectocarpus siliculosus TaxID=2880 RepID=E6ZET9_ECTSI|nr:Putative orf183, mitochondrial hypothetical protein [Ectocarpus siliculosus]CBJ18031.1 Putative orf183, hypothetical mitochondrial protein [Ectocarpus siliculosus]
MLFLKNLYRNLPSSFSVSTSFLLLGLINFISLSLLLFWSPVYGACWLLTATLYFLFKGDYKNIFIVWVLFFCIWYFFFIACLSDYKSSILIGGEHTKDIMMYFSYKYSPSSCYWYSRLFKDFCYQTVIMLDFLSIELGFPVYIPSVFAVLKFFMSFLKSIFDRGDEGPAQCAGEKNSKKKRHS